MIKSTRREFLATSVAVALGGLALPKYVRAAPQNPQLEGVVSAAYHSSGLAMSDVRESMIPPGNQGYARVVEALVDPLFRDEIYRRVGGQEASNLVARVDGKEYPVDSQGFLRDSDATPATTTRRGLLLGPLGKIKQGTPNDGNTPSAPSVDGLPYAQFENGLHELEIRDPTGTFYNHKIQFRAVDGEIRPFLMIRSGMMVMDPSLQGVFGDPFLDEHDLNNWHSVDRLAAIHESFSDGATGRNKAYAGVFPRSVDPGHSSFPNVGFSPKDIDVFLRLSDHFFRREFDKVGYQMFDVDGPDSRVVIQFGENGDNNTHVVPQEEMIPDIFAVVIDRFRTSQTGAVINLPGLKGGDLSRTIKPKGVPVFDVDGDFVHASTAYSLGHEITHVNRAPNHMLGLRDLLDVDEQHKDHMRLTLDASFDDEEHRLYMFNLSYPETFLMRASNILEADIFPGTYSSA